MAILRARACDSELHDSSVSLSKSRKREVPGEEVPAGDVRHDAHGAVKRTSQTRARRVAD
eukprot:2743318-Amphidinium_carterae.1